MTYRPFGIPMPNPHEAEDPREAEREQATPILDHIYSGPAWLISPVAEETISGAFRVIERGEHFAILGNGEMPENRWMIFPDQFTDLEKA